MIPASKTIIFIPNKLKEHLTVLDLKIKEWEESLSILNKDSKQKYKELSHHNINKKCQNISLTCWYQIDFYQVLQSCTRYFDYSSILAW